MKRKVAGVAFAGCLTLCILLVALFIIGRSEITDRVTVDPEQVRLVQLDTMALKINDDAEVAVIETDKGKMMAELYTGYAPQTVGLFKELASEGYYDGTYIFEIGMAPEKNQEDPENQEDQDETADAEKQKLYFSGGSRYSDGTLEDGYDKKREKLANEFSQDLWPFRGSFMSLGKYRTTFLNSQKVIYGGSRFMVCGSIEFTDDICEEMKKGKTNTKIEDAFISCGGLPNASQVMTVYAQAFYGADTLEKILSETDTDNKGRPVGEVCIKNISICRYADVRKEAESAGPEKKFTAGLPN